MPSGGSHLRYDESVRIVVGNQLELGMRPSDIVEANGVSPSFVTQQKRRNEVEALGLSLRDGTIQGRPKKITHEAAIGIHEFLQDFPTARRDEICDLLHEDYGIDVHPTTVGTFLKKAGITNKIVSKINIRRDDELVTSFLAEVAHYTARQIVAVDESAANERTSDRKYGWSPRGLPCRIRQSNQRTTRWSILPALTMDGWLHYEVYHGSFDGDRFLAFIEQLLPMMNPFPGPRSVLLMDNASTHHGAAVGALCRQYRVRLLYLPPYSPDLNPIEMSFHELKEWMRKNREIGYEYEEEFETFIHLGMSAVCPREYARNYFRKCGYSPIESDDEENDEEE